MAAKHQDAIFFWRSWEIPYGVFWSSTPFTDLDGLVWQNMEQYIMAMKARLFDDQASFARIRQCHLPSKCKLIGRQVKGFNAKVWKKKAPFYAYIGNKMKFEQNPALQQLLLSTGERPIYEASPHDCIWGIGLAADEASRWSKDTFPGTNLLGNTLMKVRGTLRNCA